MSGVTNWFYKFNLYTYKAYFRYLILQANIKPQVTVPVVVRVLIF